MFLLSLGFAADDGGAGGGQGSDSDDQSWNGGQNWDDPSKKGNNGDGGAGAWDGDKDDEFDKLSPEELKSRLKQKKAEQKAKDEKWKKDKEKLSAYESAEKKAEEKKLKEKWDYEKLLSDKDTEIATLKEKASKWDAHEQTQTEANTKKIEEVKKKVPKEILDNQTSILEKLPLEDQIKFLETIVSQLPWNFKNEAWGGDWKDVKPKTEYEKALKDGDIKNALANAPSKTKG